MFVHISGGERITAIGPAPQRKARLRDVHVVGMGRRLGARGGRTHGKLWQVDACIRRKGVRPSPARQQHPVRPEPALLGDDARDSAGLHIERPRRAVLDNHGARAPGGPRQGGDRDEGLAAPVRGGDHSARVTVRQVWYVLFQLRQ